MSLRNYIYVSDRKLDVYLPQIAGPSSVETTLTAGIDVKVASLAVAHKSSASPDSHHKIERVLAYLRAKRSLGTIDGTMEWFEGTSALSSIMTDTGLFFYAAVPVDDDLPVKLLLLASRDHMIGPDYTAEHKPGDSVGPSQTCYREVNSNNVTFINNLSKVSRAAWLAEGVDTLETGEASIYLARFQPDEAALGEREDANDAMFRLLCGEAQTRWLPFMRPDEPALPASYSEAMKNFVRRPWLKRQLGRELFERKKEAVRLRYLRGVIADNVLDYGELNLVSAASDAMSGGADPVPIHFVARRLLEGYRVKSERAVYHRQRMPGFDYDKRITIASPLFMAIPSRF